MPVTRNACANTREVWAGTASQGRPTPSATAEDVTRRLQQLKITSFDDKQHQSSRFLENASSFMTSQPTGDGRSEFVHPNPSTTTIFRPAKKGPRRDPYDTDTPALPPRFARRKLIQAKRLVAQQTERERPYQTIPAQRSPDNSMSSFVEGELAGSLSTQLQLSPTAPTTSTSPAPSMVKPEYQYLDVDTLKKTLDDILAESDPAPSLGGSDCSSVSSCSSLPSPTSSVTTLPVIASHDISQDTRRGSGKVQTTKSIKGYRSSSTPYASVDRRSKQTRSAGPRKDSQDIPHAVILVFNRINGVQCTLEECKELLKYRSPDPRKVYRANPGNPEKAKEILAQHRVIWGLHFSLRYHLEQWNTLCDSSGYEAENECDE